MPYRPGRVEVLTCRDALISAAVARMAWKWWSSRQPGGGKAALITTSDNVPKWLVADQKYIKTGYRRPCSVTASLCSCGCCHNETYNIWSHVVASIWFVMKSFWKRDCASSLTQHAANSTEKKKIPHCRGYSAPRMTSAPRITCFCWNFRYAVISQTNVSLGILHWQQAFCMGLARCHTRSQVSAAPDY